MAVPAPYTLHTLTFHSLVTWNRVLHNRTKESAMVRDAANKRWPIVEYVRIRFVAVLDRLFECAVCFPALHPVFFVL